MKTETEKTIINIVCKERDKYGSSPQITYVAKRNASDKDLQCIRIRGCYNPELQYYATTFDGTDEEIIKLAEVMIEQMNEVKFYRKKPVIIQAYRTNEVMYIETLEGIHKANVGDYIITGVHGEQYPCKPDIFKKTYEQVSEKDYNALKDKPIYSEIICYSKEEYENTIKAIERQKVKEPIPTHKICRIGKCPTCEQSLFLDDEELFYCPTCGQKLK